VRSVHANGTARDVLQGKRDVKPAATYEDGPLKVTCYEV
jgi:hypothetical protein